MASGPEEARETWYPAEVRECPVYGQIFFVVVYE